MRRPFNLGNRLMRAGWQDDRAAQIVEFAVSLPLLVLFVVGIFDFSGAYTLKQKLTNVAAAAARTAGEDTSTDLQASLPISVVDGFDVITNFMRTNNMDSCGITASGSPTGLTWTFTKTTGACSLTITINRGYYYPVTGAALPGVNCTSQAPGGQLAVIGTCVSIQYNYPWKFGKVASLLGRATTLPTQISAVGVALNDN